MTNTVETTTIDTAEANTPVVETLEAPALNHVERLVATFRARMESDNIGLGNLQVQGRTVVWTQIGVAYELARDILQDANKADYEAALSRCGIATAKSTPKWLPVTKLLYGSYLAADGQTIVPWDDSRDTIFREDRSAEKYAIVFRYFDRMDIRPTDVLQTIRDFNDPVHGRNLKGIEKAERAHGQKASGTTITDAQALTLGSNANANDVISFPKPKGLDHAMGTAFFKVMGDRIYLFGTSEIGEDAFNKKATARGKKLFTERAKAIQAAATLKAVEADLGITA